MKDKMEAALVIVMIVYSLFYPLLYAFAIPGNYISVTMVEIPPQTYARILDYDPHSGALLLEVLGGREGPSIIAASPRGSLLPRLRGASLVGGCIANESFKIVAFSRGFNLLTIRGGSLENSTLPGPTAIPLATNVTCSQGNLYLIYSTTINNITIYNITGKRLTITLLPGTLVDSLAYNETLTILARLGARTVVYTLHGDRLEEYTLPEEAHASSIIGPGLLAGYAGNSSYIVDLASSLSISLHYRGGRAPIEAGLRLEKGYMILVRPPGDWMHLVYLSGEGRSREVEVFYTLAYTFDRAGVRSGYLWAGGTLYNGSRRMAAVMVARGVVRGMVGYNPTLLLSVNPGIRANVTVKNLPVDVESMELNTSSRALRTGQASHTNLEEYKWKPTTTPQYYDWCERLLTGIVLDILVLVPAYPALKRSLKE